MNEPKPSQIQIYEPKSSQIQIYEPKPNQIQVYQKKEDEVAVNDVFDDEAFIREALNDIEVQHHTDSEKLIQHALDDAGAYLFRQISMGETIFPELEELEKEKEEFILKFIESKDADDIRALFVMGFLEIDDFSFLSKENETFSIKELIQLVANFVFGIYLGNNKIYPNFNSIFLKFKNSPPTLFGPDSIADVSFEKSDMNIQVNVGLNILYVWNFCEENDVPIDKYLMSIGIHEGDHIRLHRKKGELRGYDRTDKKYFGSDTEFMAIAKQFAVELFYYGIDSPLMTTFILPFYSDALDIRRSDLEQ